MTDPFNEGRFRVQAGDDNVVQITERTFGARAVCLTMQYNYGRAPTSRVPRPEQSQSQAGFL